MLEINIISKTFPAQGKADAHVAIRDFNLTLHKGEFVCLLGPSGCGKTTLLSLIAGLDKEFSGQINVEKLSTYEISYVFQNPRLLPWRTVRENIELAFNHQSPSVYIDTLLDAMQLTPFQHVYPARLSLGMSRRVAIIRAFANKPDLLLMDEPLVSLDAPTAKLIRLLLIDLWQQRPHLVLFVTHDLREAISLADRIVFLSPAPTQVLSEVIVTIPRDQRENEQQIDAFRQQILQSNPAAKILTNHSDNNTK